MYFYTIKDNAYLTNRPPDSANSSSITSLDQLDLDPIDINNNWALLEVAVRRVGPTLEKLHVPFLPLRIDSSKDRVKIDRITLRFLEQMCSSRLKSISLPFDVREGMPRLDRKLDNLSLLLTNSQSCRIPRSVAQENAVSTKSLKLDVHYTCGKIAMQAYKTLVATLDKHALESVHLTDWKTASLVSLNLSQFPKLQNLSISSHSSLSQINCARICACGGLRCFTLNRVYNSSQQTLSQNRRDRLGHWEQMLIQELGLEQERAEDPPIFPPNLETLCCDIPLPSNLPQLDRLTSLSLRDVAQEDIGRVINIAPNLRSVGYICLGEFTNETYDDADDDDVLFVEPHSGEILAHLRRLEQLDTIGIHPCFIDYDVDLPHFDVLKAFIVEKNINKIDLLITSADDDDDARSWRKLYSIVQDCSQVSILRFEFCNSADPGAQFAADLCLFCTRNKRQNLNVQFCGSVPDWCENLR